MKLDVIQSITLTLVIFLIAICITDKYIHKIVTNSPVEEFIKIDSIKKENDKLIIEIENLDSIKDAEIIEVKSLDNDSTLKLFYKLIKQ